MENVTKQKPDTERTNYQTKRVPKTNERKKDEPISFDPETVVRG